MEIPKVNTICNIKKNDQGTLNSILDFTISIEI